jgi:gamma-carbonic anhydrase
MIAAGSIVEPGATVPSGELWAGNPARKLRALKPEEAQYLETLPSRYTELAAQHEKVFAHLRHVIETKTGVTHQ